MKMKTILVGILLAVPLLANGQSSRSLPILEINPDARTAAMGGNQYGEAATMGLYANPTTLLYKDKKWAVSAATQIFPSADDDIGRLMFYGVSAGRRFGNHGVQVGFRYLGGYNPSGQQSGTETGRLDAGCELFIPLLGSFFGHSRRFLHPQQGRGRGQHCSLQCWNLLSKPI